MNVEDIASGQKVVIYTIVANFLVNISQRFVPELGIILYVLAFVVMIFSIYGVYRLCTGLNYSIGLKLLMMVLMFIPLVNLLTLVVLNIEGTRKLRGAGYEVGFFGVK